MKKGYVVLLVIVTICVLIFGIISNINKTKEEENDINIVTNYSDFYTIDNCASRFVNSIIMQDAQSLFKQLSESYKKDNSVHNSNVLNIIGNIDSTGYKSKKMYYEKINDNVTKYYIYGILVKEVFGSNMNVVSENVKDYYLIIYLNEKNDTFSVEPYDGKIFIEGDIDAK